MSASSPPQPAIDAPPPPPPMDAPPPPPPDVAPPPPPSPLGAAIPPPPSEAAPPPPPFAAAPPPPPPSSAASASTSSAIPPVPELSDREKDLLLSRESNAFYQELELDRVLAAFKLDPYDILDLPLEADEKTVTKAYRKKSLLLHPDKVKDPRAVEAFDLLKKASSQLLDKDKRSHLDETVITARMLVLKDLGLPATTPRTDAALKKLEDRGMIPSFDERVRKETKAIMIDDELRRRKAIRLQHAAEGEAERKKEAAIAERKRKAEESVRWEETREERVSGWRTFQKGGKKKRKDGSVLG